MPSIDRIVRKQIERTEGAIEDFKDGVRDCKVDPIAEALKKNDKRKAKLMESFTKKTWENTMSKLNKSDWQNPTLAKADNLATGIRASEGKIRNFHTKFEPIRRNIQDAVRAMPDTTESQRDARVIENLKRMRAAKGIWR